MQDWRIPVDNNAVERTFRLLALGRKNWLFVDSQGRGHHLDEFDRPGQTQCT
jgi:Transposase IS66 family